MALPFANEYHLRTVAEASAKSCMICFKPSTKVLITPNNKDFFYVCINHLSDRGFASPKIDAKAEAARREKEALQRDIEAVKKEYEEKLKRKGKKKDDDKRKDADADVERERDEKIKSLEAQAGQTADDGPRVFILHKDFYNMRLDKLRQIETAKRHQARLKDPSFFPAAPTGDISEQPSNNTTTTTTNNNNNSSTPT